MAYTTINKSAAHFNTKLYTGNGGTQSITGVGHKPDWTWIKPRDATGNHRITDAVRGVTKQIYADLNNAENTNTNGLTAFGTDGFTVGSDGGYNGNGVNFASWNWKANGQGSANTAGSINTTYTSANTTAGFSISKFTGNATDNATVGHGLGAVPDMIIGKDLGDTSSWGVWHKGLTNAGYRLTLSSSAAQSDDPSFFGGGSRTLPTSSVFSLGSGGGLNQSGAANIVYCFAEKTGYSKFGSYTGNGSASSGTFIYTGFKPQFIITKRTDNSSGGHWIMYDTKRDPSNVSDIVLSIDASSEAGWGNTFDIDILSNGFKMRSSTTYTNVNNANYIFMAFGQSLVGSNNVPCTAR